MGELFTGVTFYENCRSGVPPTCRSGGSPSVLDPRQCANRVTADAAIDGLAGDTITAVNRAKQAILSMQRTNEEILQIDASLDERDCRESVEENEELIAIYTEGIRELESHDGLSTDTDTAYTRAPSAQNSRTSNHSSASDEFSPSKEIEGGTYL